MCTSGRAAIPRNQHSSIDPVREWLGPSEFLEISDIGLPGCPHCPCSQPVRSRNRVGISVHSHLSSGSLLESSTLQQVSSGVP